jgi:eukaryotic-like serine/threonine-protein kinase
MGLIGRLKSALSSNRLNVAKRFELLREAISGTMSKFYMARDRGTNRIVGLKILDLKKTVAFESRFQGLHKPTEGEIAVSLHHPFVVETYEHGLTTDGDQFLVMEFLGGPGLNSMLIARDKRLVTRRVEFIRQVAEALAFVHQSGYLHRDICPRNLLLTTDGSILKLTDFGLSVPFTPEFMRPGNRTGTPNYMAPELVHRRATDVRVDVFAFGVTIYELCTGELPWPSGTTGQIAMTHDQLPTAVQAHRPDLHDDLAEAIHACIEPNLAKRCPSIERFLRMIKNVEK